MGDPIHEFDHDGFRHTLESREGGGYDLFRWVRGARLWPLRDSIYPALLRELARLATQKAESLPDGSREFSTAAARWRIKLEPDGVPRLYILTEDGTPRSMPLHDVSAPHFHILGREFAALGREQGRAEAMREKVNILPGAKAIIERAEARIAALEAATRKIIEERDRWKNNYRAENHDLITARERIAELDKREADSRAEVADLLGRLEAQKARADGAEFLSEREVQGWERRRDAERQRADAAESMIAILEGELVAAKTAAAGRGMADGALCAVMCDRPDVRPEAVVFTRRGETVYALSLGESEWSALPPLPPIEPAKAGAEEREPAPPALARHDWHTHRGHVSCERCGAPFSEGRKDQACGAQP